MLSFPYFSHKFPLFSHHSNSFYHQPSYHFLSTVAEGHYSMAGFYSISLQQTHKPHKMEYENNGNVGASFLTIFLINSKVLASLLAPIYPENE